ncbi:HesA/MoeB/ThiF family protein [Streptomyces sp. NPDC057939]|uniref:HesA/MoeB/ThiF family protein n=1 Tax=Streptomyces sp. NPDC057939 TaxID=3346284 RepID=UPI0036E816DC
MNRTTLTLTTEVADRLIAIAARPVESAAVLLTRRAALPGGGLRLLGVRLLEVPDAAYHERTETALSISSDGFMPALREAESVGATAIWVHTHPAPGSAPVPSRRDAAVDAHLADTFRARTASGLYGTLIVAPHEGAMTFTGRIEGEHQAAIDRILIAGPTFRLLRSFDSDTPELPDLHDRQIRAFGTEIQRVLGDLNIAVVGAGGTGSAVAEQLVRLGIRHLTLIDPDTLSTSNLTRVYGSAPSDVGRPKVHVLAEHLTRIADGVTVEPVVGSVSRRAIAQHVVGADIVFGCTDDEAGRMRLSRFSYAYLTPLIDCGVKITATPQGQIQDVIGRITVLHPGSACLLCRRRVTPALAAAQERAAEEQAQLFKEGYAPGLPGIEPAVVAYTTATAAAAVSELIERLVGYGPTPRPSESLLLFHDRRTSSNHLEPVPGHYCSAVDVAHYGDTERYWGLNWAA